jgi:hypothetical protein
MQDISTTAIASAAANGAVKAFAVNMAEAVVYLCFALFSIYKNNHAVSCKPL